MKTSNLNKANEKRRNKHLDTLIDTTAYGVGTRRESIIRSLAEGGRIAAVEVEDVKLRSQLQREYDSIKHSFPLGNDKHPQTIKARALKDRLVGRITCLEYRLYRGGDSGAFWVVSQTAYEFAKEVLDAMEALEQIKYPQRTNDD